MVAIFLVGARGVELVSMLDSEMDSRGSATRRNSPAVKTCATEGGVCLCRTRAGKPGVVMFGEAILSNGQSENASAFLAGDYRLRVTKRIPCEAKYFGPLKVSGGHHEDPNGLYEIAYPPMRHHGKGVFTRTSFGGLSNNVTRALDAKIYWEDGSGEVGRLLADNRPCWVLKVGSQARTYAVSTAPQPPPTGWKWIREGFPHTERPTNAPTAPPTNPAAFRVSRKLVQ